MHNFTKLLLAAGLACAGSRAAQAQTLLEDFENTRLVDYPTMQGALTVVANPSKTGLNTSASVGMFVRDGSAYSTLSAHLLNGKKFDKASIDALVSNTKKITLLYRNSSATPVKVQIVPQNSAKAAVAPYTYPQGNYAGIFEATSSGKADTWETLTFTFSAAQSDATVTDADVDQLAMLINIGTDGDKGTYFIDDLKGPDLATTTGGGTGGGGTSVVTDQLYDDYEGTRVLKYNIAVGRTSGGIMLDAANPHPDAVDGSAHVLHYTRSANQYDVLFLNTTVAPLADITPFENGTKKMTMKVYSTAPGDVYQVTLQDSSVSLVNDYPKGRKSEYKATTTATNAWETLVFALANSPDPSVSVTSINQLVLLINPGKTVAGEFFIDDWTGPRLTNYTPTAVRNQTTTAELVSIYPNPAHGVAHVPFTLKQGATVSVSVYDALGRRVAQPLDSQARAAGSHVVDVNTSRLTPGLYTCRLVVNGVTLSRQLNVE